MKGVCTRHSPFVISCDPIWKGTGHDSLAKYVPHFIPTLRFFTFGANSAIFGTGKPKTFFFISFQWPRPNSCLFLKQKYFCSCGQGVHFDNSHPLRGEKRRRVRRRENGWRQQQFLVLPLPFEIHSIKSTRCCCFCCWHCCCCIHIVFSLVGTYYACAPSPSYHSVAASLYIVLEKTKTLMFVLHTA